MTKDVCKTKTSALHANRQFSRHTKGLVLTEFGIFITISLILSSSPALSNGINVEKISDHLHVLNGKGYGTNIGLIEVENGLVLIDPMPGNDQLGELDKAIQSISNKPVTFILNTHAHSDHTGGNEYFKKRGGKFVESEFNVDGFAHTGVNSHSEIDNIYYHEKSNAIFVGDIFDGSWHPTFYSGGIKGFDEAINAILSFGDDHSLIIPGHGSPANKSSLLEFRENTFEWINKIRELHRKGWNIERIMDDSQVKDILGKFNVNNKSPFVPQKAFRRFILTRHEYRYGKMAT